MNPYNIEKIDDELVAVPNKRYWNIVSKKRYEPSFV